MLAEKQEYAAFIKKVFLMKLLLKIWYFVITFQEY